MTWPAAALDQWADDVAAFPVEVLLTTKLGRSPGTSRPAPHQQDRLARRPGTGHRAGHRQGRAHADRGRRRSRGSFRTGLEFGVRYRQQGWGRG
ncbi:MAG: hypothetical protein R2851_01190 [Caldilineaceae bacterium]